MSKKRKKKLNGFQLKQQRNFLGNTKEIIEHYEDLTIKKCSIILQEMKLESYKNKV